MKKNQYKLTSLNYNTFMIGYVKNTSIHISSIIKKYNIFYLDTYWHKQLVKIIKNN